jgi:hypothetical protein
MSRSLAQTLALVAALAWSSMARAQVKLEWKFAEGSQAKIETTEKTNQLLEINGVDVRTGSETVTTTTRSVEAKRSDNNLPIREKVESLRSRLHLPGDITISFDSANPDAGKPDHEQLAFLHDLFKLTVGLEYTIVLDPKDNKVAAIEGTEKLQAKIDELEDTAKILVKDQISADKFKQEFERELGVLPTTLVREGDTWDRTEVLGLGGAQTFTFERQYEYKGTVEQDGKTLDRIVEKVKSVTLTTEPNAPLPAKITKSDLKVDSSEGEILFDREAGQIVSRKDVTKIKGPMTLEVNGQELPTRLELTMEKATKLQKAAE